MNLINSIRRNAKFATAVLMATTTIGTATPMLSQAADFQKVVNFTRFDANGTYEGYDAAGEFYYGNMYNETVIDNLRTLGLPLYDECFDYNYVDTFCSAWRESTVTLDQLKTDLKENLTNRFVFQNGEYVELPALDQSVIDVICSYIVTLPKNDELTDYSSYFAIWG